MQKITPCLWFNNNVEEAVKFYTSLFENSKIHATTHYGDAGSKASGQPKGTIMTMVFELEGFQMMALNGGPHYKMNPSISFSISSGSEKEIDELYKKLREGGEVLMELGKYPFSEKYGWVNDRFGVSWQINLATREPKICPYFMFVGDQHGKAEEAIEYYISLFENSKIESMYKHGEESDETVGTVAHAVFSLAGQEFMALDSGKSHALNFSPATSFIVYCDDQNEIDNFWKKLSAGGQEGQCGWLTDKYGVSWQVVPAQLQEMLLAGDDAKLEPVMSALMKMKKLEVRVLQEAAGR